MRHTRTHIIALAALAVLALTMLVALAASETEAGGSGDYPPPASGHWRVDEATSVWSERIEMRGNIYVYAPLTLNLVNLTFNCTSNAQYGLYVYSGGSLSFNNGNITAVNKSNHYRFLVYDTTAIRNSELSEAYYGVEVRTKKFTMTDCTVFDMNAYGLYFYLSYTLTGNVLIKDNEFISNNNYGIYCYQYASVNRVDYDAVMTGDITIRGNYFTGNLGGGVYIYRYMYAYYSYEAKMFTNLTIEGNEIVDNRGYSIFVYTYLYNYQGGDDGKITARGAINVNNNTIKDNSGSYAVYYRNSISIYYGSDAMIHSDVNMVGNVITGNKGAYAIYLYNSIYGYYGRDARVRINLRMEANNISDNGGHAIFVDSVSNTQYGLTGICTNDGDIILKDNVIRDNLGTGIYVYRYAYADQSQYASITGNTTFEGNTITGNSGYGGAYLYSYCRKYKGDENGTANIWGSVRFSKNTFSNNIGYGAYVLRYSRSYYGGTSSIIGDVLFEGNKINKNTGYGGYVFYDAYKQYGAESGVARVISNATFRQNEMSGNSGAHGFYYYKRTQCYYSSYSELNGTVIAEQNTIEDNKGYGFYIYAYAYNYQGALGNTYITGDIWVRDNVIRRNGGGGVYLTCYSYSYNAKSADIYQNITFLRNTVTDNGYTGFYIYVRAYSNRALGGDTSIVGDILYKENKVSGNSYHGVYFYRYATAYYTSSTTVSVKGDVVLDDNEVNANYNYGLYIISAVHNEQSGLAGRAVLDSDHVLMNNTVKDNLYWAAAYLVRSVSAYYTGEALLDSNLSILDNTITGNRGTGLFVDDNCNQYYYGGAGDPERGSFTQKGVMEVLRNTINTNAGDGLYINTTIDAEVRTIEPAPRIEDNSISYNGGDFGFYCDMRDITKAINIKNNVMDHNEVQYVAVVSNSGTAPDIIIKDNKVRHNTVEHTTFGLIMGEGDYRATFSDNNVSYNDAREFVLALDSKDRIEIRNNAFYGNTNSTAVMSIRGSSNESSIDISSNVLRDNHGHGIYAHALGELEISQNTVVASSDSGIVAATDIAREVVEAELTIVDNLVTDNGGNGVWSVSMNVLEVERNTVLRNGAAGIRVNAMKVLPTIRQNTIDANTVGLYLAGDNLAPLTTTYNIVDITATDSLEEGLYAEDLTVQMRRCTVTGSGKADLAVRRARIDCYSTTVGYGSGHVYESGYIRVWWRVDIDVRWQSGEPVPDAHVVLASDTDNSTYRELDTDGEGHIDPFNVEEWSMVDTAVHLWSPYRCTASKNTESSTQVETVNRSRNILIILVDEHLPQVMITAPEEGALLNVSIINVKGTASDGGSGLVAVRVRVDDGEWTEMGLIKSFSKLVHVDDGSHTVTVQGEDLAGMLGNATVNITIDTVAPMLLVVRPEEGALTNVSLLEVEGRVLEGGLEVTVNGVPQDVGVDNTFLETVRLFEGPNLIRVWAQDPAGNQRLIFVNVTLDTIAPPLTVDSPADHYLTSDPSLTVVGRTEPGARVAIGEVEGIATPAGGFSLEVDLSEGDNLLTVTANDAALNYATVFRYVRLDTQPPAVSVTEPEDGLLTKEDRVQVVGTVEWEEGTVLSVAGSFVLPGDDGTFEYAVDLIEGENDINVTARDRAGNEAWVVVKVTRRTNPPKLVITRPDHDYLVTNEVRYTIRGETAPDVELRVAGDTIPLDLAGNFSAEVQLTTGENTISIVALDVLGNENRAVVHLILDTEPPSLVIEFPYDGYRTERDRINVTGRTDVGASLTINGVDVPVDDTGAFDFTLSLRTGSQNVSVLSTDGAGNEAVQRLSVERFTPEEPVEPSDQKTAGSSAGLILAVIVVLAAVAGVGYVLYMRRRGGLEGG